MRRCRVYSGSLVAMTLLLTAVLAGCGSSPSTTGSVVSTASGSPQEVLNSIVSSTGTVGAAAAIVTPGPDGKPQVQYYNAGASAVGGSPVNQQTVFEIGSLTKVFTADLLATMVAQGKISLADPLQRYAPSGVTVPTFTTSSGTVVPITIGNLATHQAGLPYPAPNLAAGCPGGTICPDYQTLYSRDIMWQQLAQTTLLSQPGTDWLYSNFGFGILGTVLADLAQPGQANPPYQEVLQSQVLTHFSMPNTALETAGEQMATGYALTGNQPTAQPQWLDTNALAGAGGLVSTTTDLAVWMQAHLGYPVSATSGADQPLQQTLQLVSTAATVCNQSQPPQCSNQAPQAPQQMGLGWQLQPPVGEITQSWATKDGGTSGFVAQVFLAPSSKVGVVLLANTASATFLQTQAVELFVQALAQQ